MSGDCSGASCSRNAPANSDLRCELREKLIAYPAREYPSALPGLRQEPVVDNAPSRALLSENRWARARG
jgi:hypothetical protein